MKTRISILAIVAVCMTPSCSALKEFPVTLGYSGQAAGHDFSASYSKEQGLAVAAERLKALSQK